MMTKVFKLTVLLIDHDGIGLQNVKSEIHNVRGSPVVMKCEERSVHWHDGHPLNFDNTIVAEFVRIFTAPAGRADAGEVLVAPRAIDVAPLFTQPPAKEDELRAALGALLDAVVDDAGAIRLDQNVLITNARKALGR